jgi:hypothetical protein
MHEFMNEIIIIFYSRIRGNNNHNFLSPMTS